MRGPWRTAMVCGAARRPGQWWAARRVRASDDIAPAAPHPPWQVGYRAERRSGAGQAMAGPGACARHQTPRRSGIRRPSRAPPCCTCRGRGAPKHLDRTARAELLEQVGKRMEGPVRLPWVPSSSGVPAVLEPAARGLAPSAVSSGEDATNKATTTSLGTDRCAADDFGDQAVARATVRSPTPGSGRPCSSAAPIEGCRAVSRSSCRRCGLHVANGADPELGEHPLDLLWSTDHQPALEIV